MQRGLGHLGCELAVNARSGIELGESGSAGCIHLCLEPADRAQTPGSWKCGERTLKSAQPSMALLPGWKSEVMSKP